MTSLDPWYILNTQDVWAPALSSSPPPFSTISSRVTMASARDIAVDPASQLPAHRFPSPATPSMGPARPTETFPRSTTTSSNPKHDRNRDQEAEKGEIRDWGKTGRPKPIQPRFAAVDDGEWFKHHPPDVPPPRKPPTPLPPPNTAKMQAKSRFRDFAPPPEPFQPRFAAVDNGKWLRHHPSVVPTPWGPPAPPPLPNTAQTRPKSRFCEINPLPAPSLIAYQPESTPASTRSFPASIPMQHKVDYHARNQKLPVLANFEDSEAKRPRNATGDNCKRLRHHAYDVVLPSEASHALTIAVFGAKTLQLAISPGDLHHPSAFSVAYLPGIDPCKSPERVCIDLNATQEWITPLNYSHRPFWAIHITRKTLRC